MRSGLLMEMAWSVVLFRIDADRNFLKFESLLLESFTQSENVLFKDILNLVCLGMNMRLYPVFIRHQFQLEAAKFFRMHPD